jgi:preprotein translocase subunit SecG
MLLIMHLIMMALFIVLGMVFLRGKGAFLIAGYNTASASEKAKTDEKKLCAFMAKFMFVLAGCWFLMVLSAAFDSTFLLWLGLAVFFIAIIIGVIYANTGNRFAK